MRKINLKVNFRDVKGEIVSGLISDSVAEALYVAGSAPELAIANTDKYRAYKIFRQIIENDGIVELTSEDITLVKEVTANYLNVGGYGQVYELLEGEA